MTVTYEWRGDFENAALNQLHARGFGHPLSRTDWRTRPRRHSLGWAREWEDERLVGFVNVAWDGAVHAFVLDTVVAPPQRSRGVESELVRTAAEKARAAGCAWLHVDFESPLRLFYPEVCGFGETLAG